MHTENEHQCGEPNHNPVPERLEHILTALELDFNDSEKAFILETAQHFRYDYSHGAELPGIDYITAIEQIGSYSIAMEHLSDKASPADRIKIRRGFFRAHAVWELMHITQHPFDEHGQYFERVRSYLKSGLDETLETGKVHNYHQVLLKLTGVDQCVKEIHHRFSMFKGNLYEGNMDGVLIERDSAARALGQYRKQFSCQLVSNEGFCTLLDANRRFVVDALMKKVDECLKPVQVRKEEGLSYLKRVAQAMEFNVVPVFPKALPVRFSEDGEYKSNINEQILLKGQLLQNA